jgi:hypothetical protein
MTSILDKNVRFLGDKSGLSPWSRKIAARNFDLRVTAEICHLSHEDLPQQFKPTGCQPPFVTSETKKAHKKSSFATRKINAWLSGNRFFKAIRAKPTHFA